jgi:branched-chain amino acid transport system ATP-binding protein
MVSSTTASPGPTLLSVTGLSTGYRRRAVVWDIDLRVDAGSIVALLGANGAGKSTTLLGVTGHLPLMAGEVTINGSKVVPARRPDRLIRHGVALVPQERALFPRLTVGQHLRLVNGYGKESRERVFEFFPQLAPLERRRAGLLSGGEQQMLALARALTSNPSVLIVDEMSQGLAPLIVAQLFQLLSRLARNERVGVLLVEQQVKNALSIADEAIVLTHGRCTLRGRAAEMLANPDALEASYLGRIGDSESDELNVPLVT